MKVLAYNFKVPCDKKGSRPICMIRMNRMEALETIKSLSNQLIANSPNVGRYEQFDVNGIDFSIAVSDAFDHPEYEQRAEKFAKSFSKPVKEAIKLNGFDALRKGKK